MSAEQSSPLDSSESDTPMTDIILTLCEDTNDYTQLVELCRRLERAWAARLGLDNGT